MKENPHFQTAKHLLRIPRFDYRHFPEPSPIRNLLLVNCRWRSEEPGADILTLGKAAKLYAQLADGHLLALEPIESEAMDIPVTGIFDAAHQFLALNTPGIPGPRVGRRENLPAQTNLGISRRDGLKALSIDTSSEFDPMKPLEEARNCLLFRVLGCLMKPNDAAGGRTDEPFLGEIIESLGTSDEYSRLSDALSCFRATLDHAGMQLCNEVNLHTADLYNYLVATPEHLAQYRRQAIAAFPALADYLASSTNSQAVLIRMAIDLRQPLIDSIAEAFGVTRDVVKCVAGKTADEIGFDVTFHFAPDGHPHWAGQNPDAMPIDELFSGLNRVPANLRPTTQEDWRELHVIHELISRDWLNEEPIAARILRFFAEGGWARASAAISREYGSLQSIADSSDFLDAIHDVLSRESAHRQTTGLPFHGATGKRINRQNSAKAVVGFGARIGLRRLLDLSRRWHEKYADAVARQLDSALGADKVLFPFNVPILIEGHFVAPLLSYADLVLEGVAMRNCVASRYERVLSEGVRVFSVRNESGQRLSTFDLSFSLENDVLKIRINEHRGPANSDPSSLCRTVLDMFLSQLNAEPWLRKLKALVTHLNEQTYRDQLKSQESDEIEEMQLRLKRDAVMQTMGRELRKMILQCTRPQLHDIAATDTPGSV